MRHRLFALVFFLQSLFLVAQQRPLVTEPANTVEGGHLQFDLGFEFYQNAVYRLSGLEGDLSRLGVLGLRLGVGKNVEVQVTGTIQDVLNVNHRFDAPNTPILDFTGDSTSDVGDFTLATKVRFKQESDSSPALGFRFGVDLPNASNQSGLGNDEFNAFGTFLVEKGFGRLRTIGNAGIIIMGDPTDASAQDDLFTFGAALVYGINDRFSIVADFYGRLGPGGIGTEEQTRLRVGAQIEAGGLYWDVSGFVGFRDTDPDSGVLVGVSKDFKLWDL